MDLKKTEDNIFSSLRSEIMAKDEELKEVYFTFTKLQSTLQSMKNDAMDKLVKELADVKANEKLLKAELKKTKEKLSESIDKFSIEESAKDKIKDLYRETMNELSHAKR